MSIILAILGFSLLVVLHELGHWLLARLTGMRVLKFSIGFGPSLVRFERGGTTYQLALIPAGGFVQIAGLGTDEGAEEPGSYRSRPLWQRALVIAGGPLANFLFAAGLYVYLFASFGATGLGGGARLATPVIASVSGPAAQAGLKSGDVVVAIDDTPIVTFQEIRVAAGKSEGRPLTLKVARRPEGEAPSFARIPLAQATESREGDADGLIILVPIAKAGWPRLTFKVAPEKTERGYLLGLTPEVARVGTESLATAVQVGLTEPVELVKRFISMVTNALRGEEELELASVVRITQMGADRVKAGSSPFFDLLAFISVNLAFLNLLPLPALDGGRLLFLGVEAIARRPVPRKVEGIIHGVGILLLSLLMVWAVVGDVFSLFNR